MPVGMRAVSPSQPENRFLCPQSKLAVQCSTPETQDDILFFAAPVIPARNNDSDVAASCGLTSRCLRTTFKFARRDR